MTTNPRLPLPNGTIIENRYRIESILGSGAFGITYKAYDLKNNRYSALKECIPEEFSRRGSDHVSVIPKDGLSVEDFELSKKSFINEALILTKLKHKNLLSANEIVSSNGTIYMDSTYLNGQNLENILDSKKKGRSVHNDDVIYILKSIAEGLKEVHKLGFIHRDIKPSNIIINNSNTPILIDFGGARLSKSAKKTIIYSGGYAPIEQLYNNGRQGPWTDIYALGAVGYAMITRRLPPNSSERQSNDKIIKLSDVYAGRYNKNLLKAIDLSLEIDSRMRPQSVDEFISILLGESSDSLQGKLHNKGDNSGKKQNLNDKTSHKINNPNIIKRLNKTVNHLSKRSYPSELPQEFLNKLCITIIAVLILLLIYSISEIN